MEVVQAAVGVDVDLHPGANGLAHSLNAFDIFSDHVRQRPGLVLTLQTVVAHRHLETCESSVDP